MNWLVLFFLIFGLNRFVVSLMMCRSVRSVVGLLSRNCWLVVKGWRRIVLRFGNIRICGNGCNWDVVRKWCWFMRLFSRFLRI